MEHNFENTNEKEIREKLLPGQVVVDPNDQASLLAAIDEEIRLLQSSDMVEAVRMNNGYEDYDGDLCEGDFSLKFGYMDKDGVFKEYSYEEFSYEDYYKALTSFEEGRQRLFTYCKLLTAYLRYDIGEELVMPDEGILHAHAFLWLLMKDPKAHHLFPAYQLAAGEYRSYTENEPAYHYEMIRDCLKDCKEVAHTMVNLFSYSGDYMMEEMERSIDKFPFERFIEDEEWLDELHRAFAAAYMDKRTRNEESENVDIEEIEEDYEYFFQKKMYEYMSNYFFDEDLDKAADKPENLLEIYAELKGKEVEDINKFTAEWLNKLSKLYPVFDKLDECIDLQKIQQIVFKTIKGEMDFPRIFGREIDIDDLPELMNSEEVGDLLGELTE